MAGDKLSERNKELDLYLRGAANLYGYMPTIQFLIVFNRYHKEAKLSADDLLKSAPKLNRTGRGCYAVYSNAVLSLRAGEEIIKQIILKQAEGRFYIPSKEEIALYSDNEYYELTGGVQRLIAFVEEKYSKFNEERRRSLIRETEWTVRTGQGFDRIFKSIKTLSPPIRSVSEADLLRDIFLEMCGDVRTWENCGFKKTEL